MPRTPGNISIQGPGVSTNKGGTVIFITVVIFAGYLYLSRRLQAVYNAIRYGSAAMKEPMPGEGTSPGGASPGGANPGGPPILPPNLPQPGVRQGYADIPWPGNIRPPERVYFTSTTCRFILYTAFRSHGFTDADARAELDRLCSPPGEGGRIRPGVMLP
jgi:hypothetical protein